MTEQIYDVVIIGAGPSGIQAAIHASRKKTSVLLLGHIENSALYKAHVENYACVAGVNTGQELLENGITQVKHFGTEMLAEDVLKVSQDDIHFQVEIESGRHINTRTIIPVANIVFDSA